MSYNHSYSRTNDSPFDISKLNNTNVNDIDEVAIDNYRLSKFGKLLLWINIIVKIFQYLISIILIGLLSKIITEMSSSMVTYWYVFNIKFI